MCLWSVPITTGFLGRPQKVRKEMLGLPSSKAAEPQHYWLLGPDNSLLWGCPVHRRMLRSMNVYCTGYFKMQSYLNSQLPCKKDITLIETRSWGPRDVKGVFQNQLAGKWLSWDFNPGSECDFRHISRCKMTVTWNQSIRGICRSLQGIWPQAYCLFPSHLSFLISKIRTLPALPISLD